MRATSRRVVVLVLVAVLVVAGAVVFAVASGDGTVPGREITRYDVTVDLERDGAAQVSIDLDFVFGAEPGHGPYIWLPTRQGFDEDHDRVYRVSDVTASSATGAPARRYIDRSGSAVSIRIGDEARGDITGVHQYTIGYRLEGMLNPAAGDGTFDELYWNAIGDAWEIPISNASVTVRGPVGVAVAQCFAGETGSTDACDESSHADTTAMFAETRLPPGRNLTVVVGWPAGTFEAPQVTLVPRARPFAIVDPMTPAGVVAAVILTLGAGGAVLLARRRGRDEAYVGLTPGLVPTDDGAAQVGRRDPKAPVAVQFEPPRGLRPGLVGTLLDGVADPHDVTATIVDLAVRGYLRIEEVEEDKRWTEGDEEWRLVKLRTPDLDVESYEKAILDSIFVAGQSSVRLASLRLSFAATMKKVQRELYDETVERGWYASSPPAVRTAWQAVGVALVTAAGVGGLFALVMTVPDGFLLPWLALAVVGLVVGASGKRAVGRTAGGSAVLAQTLGFRQYIATAEANQLRFEEGEDVFSRYLPFAIVFEETERWARVFAELAAQGRVPASTSWYVGHDVSSGALAVSTAGLGTALAGFTAAANISFSPPATSGSSGDSGFSGGGSSGGGGSAGGGGGGGGGGGW